MVDDRPQRVLFLCTANRIRSPFALAAAEQLRLVPPWLRGVPLASRGTMAAPGRRPMPQAVAAARELGVDLSRHRSAPPAAGELDGAWVLGMTWDHLTPTRTAGPWRTGLLGEYGNRGEIPDPVGLDIGRHRTVFEAILAALEGWAAQPPP